MAGIQPVLDISSGVRFFPADFLFLFGYYTAWYDRKPLNISSHSLHPTFFSVLLHNGFVPYNQSLWYDVFPAGLETVWCFPSMPHLTLGFLGFLRVALHILFLSNTSVSSVMRMTALSPAFSYNSHYPTKFVCIPANLVLLLKSHHRFLFG